MFSISDLTRLLEQIPVWKRLISMPAEIDALRKRVELLEKSGSRTPGADECPKCHGLAYGLDRTVDDPLFGEMGVQRHYYRCKSCGYETHKQSK